MIHSPFTIRMIAIRPPEYFPCLAYAALLLAVDCFVLADTFQYSRQSFQNRTKVRNPQGWQWVSIPLKGGQHGRPICQVEIRQVEAWQKRHWKAFEYNYRPTPYFDYYEEAFAPLFRRPWTHLAELTCATVELIHALLGGPATLVRASTLAGQPTGLKDLLDQVGPAPLLVPAASAPYDAQAVLPLRVLHYEPPRYRQAFDGFEPGLTAFDVLFNYGPEAASIIKEGVRIEAYAAEKP